MEQISRSCLSCNSSNNNKLQCIGSSQGRFGVCIPASLAQLGPEQDAIQSWAQGRGLLVALGPAQTRALQWYNSDSLPDVFREELQQLQLEWYLPAELEQQQQQQQQQQEQQEPLGEPQRCGNLSLAPCGRPASRAFVTHVAVHRREHGYPDAAVMLGLSLRQHAPGVPRIALLERTGLAEDVAQLRLLLERARWQVLLVPARRVRSSMPWYYDGIFAKIEVFRMPLEQVVYLDADTWARSPEVLQLFEALEDRPLAMTRDINSWKGHQAGVLAVRPSPAHFRSIETHVMAGENDQRAINKAYNRTEIHTLPRRFNMHGSAAAGSDAVVVHFTGYAVKPSAPRVDLLRKVSSGEALDGGLESGGAYYGEYFRAMIGPACFGYLSQALQVRLHQVVRNTSFARASSLLGYRLARASSATQPQDRKIKL
ncbi:unnamed protein product [Polarella glacialis]|uniref:Hexosyltransferase n=2 Tax=Polarella glacialis TaxID=89957 RepID=A0A813ERD5_POLGL|nr:unnamed protein product [Polarella glacialis]